MKNNATYYALLNTDKSNMSEAEWDAHLQAKSDAYVNSIDILVDHVIDKIGKDIANGDVTILETLIATIPQNQLFAYLPESEVIGTEQGLVRKLQNGDEIGVTDSQPLHLFTVKSWVRFIKKNGNNMVATDALDEDYEKTFTDIEGAKSVFIGQIVSINQRRVVYKNKRRYAKVQLCQATVNEYGVVHLTGIVLEEKDLS